MQYSVIGLWYNAKKYNTDTVLPNTIQCNTLLSNAASIQRHVGEYKVAWSHIYSLQHAYNYSSSLEAAASQTEVPYVCFQFERKDCCKVSTPEMNAHDVVVLDTWDWSCLHILMLARLNQTLPSDPFLHIVLSIFQLHSVLSDSKTLLEGIHQPWPLCKPYEFGAQWQRVLTAIKVMTQKWLIPAVMQPEKLNSCKNCKLWSSPCEWFQTTGFVV